MRRGSRDGEIQGSDGYARGDSLQTTDRPLALVLGTHALSLSLAVALMPGCGPDASRVATPANRADFREERVAPSVPPPIRFRPQSLDFAYDRGESGTAWPVETTGGGVGLLDLDGDGDLDIFFAQGTPLGAAAPGRKPRSDILLINQGAGRFVDRSESWGLTPKGYGQGVTVADYDGDGDPDVYVTRYGKDTLWRNEGYGFVDATDVAGLGDPLWGLGSAFLDADGDGDLDLFVANYFDFNVADAPFGRDPKTGAPDYGMPQQFIGQPDRFYRNVGGGRFVDVTKDSGLAGNGRGMGAIAADFDGDGRVDLIVANDAQANAAWRNLGGGRFSDVGESSGLAFNGDGKTEANMGIAFGDADGDGRPEVVMSHFFDERTTLWRNVGGDPPAPAAFQDQTTEAGLVRASRPVTGWGLALADFDDDGDLDLIQANGHLRREPEQPFVYENPPLLWRNDGKGRFADVSAGAGEYFGKKWVGRGLAVGDLDNDGDVDAVVVHHHGPATILWNETVRAGHHGLNLKLVGGSGNTDSIGGVVTAEFAGHRVVRWVTSGGSYVSSHDGRVHLGTGPSPRIDRLVVRWPSGRQTERKDLPADGILLLREDGPGETSRKPLPPEQ